MATKKNSKPNKKQIVKQPKTKKTDSKSRKEPKYKSLRLQKRIKHPAPPLPSWWSFVVKAFKLMTVNKRAMFSYLIVLGVATLLIVRGGVDPVVDTLSIRETLEDLTGVSIDGLTTSFTAFTVLLDSAATAGDAVGQLYQTIFFIIGSLAAIWLFRQQQAGNSVTMKMAFYRGMYPLIPFSLVLLVIGLQLLPAVIGNFVFQTVTSAGIVFGILEWALWVSVLIGSFMVTLYLLASSTMALYIVTLPEMTPMLALREAKKLVKHRRASVFLKIIALILFILVGLLCTILPLIYFAPTLAEWLFFVVSILMIPFIHAYLFSVYRELL
jgi:hypothetical protein